MRKTLELLALSTCTAALCVTLTGCEAVKGTATSEKTRSRRYMFTCRTALYWTKDGRTR